MTEVCGPGLAPLCGIIRDALSHGHQGSIALFHGSWEPSGLYLQGNCFYLLGKPDQGILLTGTGSVDELRALADQHLTFTYTPCVDAGAVAGTTIGRADQIALSSYSKLAGWRVYLCGHPEMVQSAKKKAFLSGASISDIYADPFLLSKSPTTTAA